MGKNKIGRNDLCPCGSGKKFKHCCMLLEDGPTADLFSRCSQLIAAVKLKLDEAYKTNIKRIRKDARQNFLYFTINQQMSSEQESLFSDWLWFDYRNEEGMTLAATYLAEHQQFMPQPLQECLNALADSYLSVYEPTRIGEDFLEMRDIFSSSLHQVTLKERLDADLNERPLLLLGRLVEFPEGQVFSGMVVAADNNDGQEAYLKQHINYLASLKNEDDSKLLLKNNPEVLFGLFDHALRKKLININDIRYLSLPDPQQQFTIQAWLKANPAMEYVHKQANLLWYQDGKAGMNKMVGVAEDYVIICAASLEALHDWTNLPGNGIKPPWEWITVNSRLHRQPPPPQLASVWFIVLQEQETERWLNTSHHELNDRTPREVIKEANGSTQVLAMLDKFAARLEEGDESTALIAYMRERVESLAQ